MATGQAKLARLADPTRLVAIGDGARVKWSPVFDHNPYLARQADADRGPVTWVVHAPMCRPYIDYDATFALGRARGGPRGDKKALLAAAGRWIWRPGHAPAPGEIFLTEAELLSASKKTAEYGRFAVIEPHIKAGAPPGKSWGWDRWQTVASALGGPLVQIGATRPKLLAGPRWIETPTIRDAAAVVGMAALVLTNEGALHHAAAAFGVPAVVIFGGFVSPDVTGYIAQKNFYARIPGSPCGVRGKCAHCEEAMASIRPDAVIEAVNSLW